MFVPVTGMSATWFPVAESDTWCVPVVDVRVTNVTVPVGVGSAAVGCVVVGESGVRVAVKVTGVPTVAVVGEAVTVTRIGNVPTGAAAAGEASSGSAKASTTAADTNDNRRRWR